MPGKADLHRCLSLVRDLIQLLDPLRGQAQIVAVDLGVDLGK